MGVKSTHGPRVPRLLNKRMRTGGTMRGAVAAAALACAFAIGGAPDARAQGVVIGLVPPDEADSRDAGDAGAPLEFPGPRLEPRTSRPAGSETWPRACSFRHALCVHADAKTPTAIVLGALASAERAWDALTGTLKIPAPWPDLSGSYDIYLVDGVTGGGATYASERDVRARFDRASSFSLVDRGLAGCALDQTIAREIARASLFRVAPATDDASARAATTYLARLVAPCPADESFAIFQRYPQRSIFDSWREADPHFSDAYMRGAALFYWFLDAEFATEPGAGIRGLWALAPTTTAFGADHWRGQPDEMDVLRMTFKGALGALTTADDLFVRFAVARAFAGAADDGEHFPESRALGEAARVRVEWDVPWPEKPRRFASANPVGPMGAAYVAIARANAPKGSGLALRAEWEEHARMRWVVVKVDAKGAATALLPVTGFDRGTEAELSVTNLDDTATVLVVGVNVGDPYRPFDPDDAVFEPHGWMLTIQPE